ncbi:glutathione S-transferase family protein [Undibacterium sp. TJN19]|uniref:glutathione S-transferase family protein n=1 Tax=Undibacterium sp. TJN19 TaxID=3413055 RepID=UPI003BF1DD17
MLKLHCFGQSGNSYKVALALRVMNIPWQAEFVDYMHGATRGDDWRETANEMGEVPVLEDGDIKLTQSGVILHYLADKYAVYGGNDEAEKREILRWILFDNHKFTSYFATYRFMKSFGPAAPDITLMNWLRSRMDAAFSIVEKHLENRAFLLGEQISIADFSLCAYLFYPENESAYGVRERYPHIAAWLDRIQALPGWAGPYDIMPGDYIAPKW